MTRFDFTFKNSLAFILLIAVMGCGGSDGVEGDGFSGERGQVSGTITIDGQPLKEGCQVLFTSETGGYSAAGIVQSDGIYKLEYSDPDGLPVGDYLVQLAAPFVPSSDEVTDPAQMAAQMKIGSDGSIAGAASAGPFPAKYSSTTTSELKFKVESGENTSDFKLSKE